MSPLHLPLPPLLLLRSRQRPLRHLIPEGQSLPELQVRPPPPPPRRLQRPERRLQEKPLLQSLLDLQPVSLGLVPEHRPLRHRRPLKIALRDMKRENQLHWLWKYLPGAVAVSFAGSDTGFVDDDATKVLKILEVGGHDDVLEEVLRVVGGDAEVLRRGLSK